MERIFQSFPFIVGARPRNPGVEPIENCPQNEELDGRPLGRVRKALSHATTRSPGAARKLTSSTADVRPPSYDLLTFLSSRVMTDWSVTWSRNEHIYWCEHVTDEYLRGVDNHD